MDEGLGWVRYISIQTEILKVRKTCPESLRCLLTPPRPVPCQSAGGRKGAGGGREGFRRMRRDRRACDVSWHLPCRKRGDVAVGAEDPAGSEEAEVMVGASRETEGMGSSTEEPEMGTKSYGESEVVGMFLPLPQPRPARTF